MSAEAADPTWRPIGRSDVPAWLELLEAVEAADRENEHPDAQGLAERFDDPYVDPARGSLAAFDGGRMVAYHWMKARTAAEPVHEFWQMGGVHPGYRGRGLGTRLLRWAESAAVPLHEERFPGKPLTLTGSCLDGHEASNALFAALGYRRTRWFHDMRLADLSAPLPEASVPEGVVFLPFTPERSEDARLVRNESFRDHWGSTETTPGSWAHFTGGSAFRPSVSLIAYEGGEPLAIVLAEEHDGHRLATGQRDLYVALVGTRRTARRRGLAGALLVHVLRKAAAEGFRTASLGVDADSPTGALGLYERIGFRAELTFVSQQKELLPAGGGRPPGTGQARPQA
ncbi:GNAT family N-acetyltransferase [Streptacidiphilus sp. ASG 303]|uniref:GNAT family N-acetyltransferase n=1 Tax=Streptacidiphilus sp. ASG 303 TaxID=2896847 RepID=UPI001E497E12|nr:GNAT family N-acetyltransferase [Streptacidiphilus sp. ASG 303]MCD0485698.1 GNAT family N-acetyltransferase [Streptacidiphilus sp. ASG 303]